jgi:hypothetical protein
LNFVDLSAADRRVQDLHQNLPDIELVRKGDLIDQERPARFGQNRGLCCLDLRAGIARYSK